MRVLHSKISLSDARCRGWLYTGAIPVEVCQLQVLKVLKLNGNQLEGECTAAGTCMPPDQYDVRLCDSTVLVVRILFVRYFPSYI